MTVDTQPFPMPAMVGRPRVGTADSIASMRALIQAGNNKAGGPA